MYVHQCCFLPAILQRRSWGYPGLRRGLRFDFVLTLCSWNFTDTATNQTTEFNGTCASPGTKSAGPWCYVEANTCKHQPLKDQTGLSYDNCATNSSTHTIDTCEPLKIRHGMLRVLSACLGRCMLVGPSLYTGLPGQPCPFQSFLSVPLSPIVVITILVSRFICCAC